MPKNNNNLSTLGAQLKQDLKKVRVELNESVKTIARKMMMDLTDSTVIDTSKAVSNWIATLDRPNENVIEANAQGSRGSTAGESIDITVLKANNAINSKKIGQPIFISNNISPDSYQTNAGLLEAEQEATDNAIIAVAKAQVLIGRK